MPYKVTQTMQYTETSYFDDDGNEVERIRNYDDFWYDSGPREELEDDELMDYFPADDEED